MLTGDKFLLLPYSRCLSLPPGVQLPGLVHWNVDIVHGVNPVSLVTGYGVIFHNFFYLGGYYITLYMRKYEVTFFGRGRKMYV